MRAISSVSGGSIVHGPAATNYPVMVTAPSAVHSRPADS